MILKDITEESLKILDESKEDSVTIFVSGGGGKVSVLQQMLYIINSNPDRFTIVTAESNDSCNLLLLLLVKCKVVVLSEARGGYHHTYQVREINSQGKPRDYYEEFMLKEIEKFRKKELRMIKELELTEEETERVERGAFVYFHADRMIELIKKDWSWFFEDSLEEYSCVNDNCTKANGGLRYHFSSKPTEYCPKCLHNSVTTVNKFQDLSVSVSNTDGANTTTTYKGGDNITNTQNV